MVETEEDTLKVLQKFHYNFALMADSLRIMNDAMVLLNPNML